MEKIYKKLSEEQIKKGIIFTSSLSRFTSEEPDGTIHEVKKNTKDKDLVIQRLEDDKFFNNSHFKYNIIRE